MFKSLKKSSPDKSASLGRSSSLRSTGNDTSTGIDPVLEARFKSLQEMLGAFLRSISNDTSTGTDPILEANFKSAQIRLGALNKEYGDVQKIGTDPNQFNYSKAQKEYKNLYDDIKTSKFSLEKEQQDSLLFGIYHGLAISAFRAGKFKEHNEHLLHAYDKYSPDRDKSIIGLEIWVKIYKNLGANAQKVPSISSQCDKLLKEVETEVQSLIKAGGYDQARTKMEYLNKNSHNFQIFELYASTIKDPKEAFKYLKEKSDKYNPIQRQDIYEIFKTLQEKFNKAGETKLAEEAATYALKYNPNPTVATASAAPVVSPEVKKAEKEFEKLKEKYDEAAFKLKTVVTLDVHTKQLEELRTKHEAELKAELEKLKTEHKAELEALKPKASPTKDTKVNDAGDFSPTSSLPPPYTSVDIGNHKYLQLVKNATTTPTAPTTPVVKVVTPLAEEVLNELTKLAHLIPSLNWQDSQYNTTKGKAKSLLSEAVKENPDVYKTIEDPKILVLLADVLLSSNKMEEARIVCKKALDADPNIWQATDDQIVLLNLAGVLLPSNQLKAEQVYSKAISTRIYFTDARGNYEMDVNKTTIVSKTVAQDGYSAAERDCLVKVCLSSNKVYQQVQAVDCYPHTDFAKREAIAGQLKQLAKQMLLPIFPSYAAYTLYSKASFVLKDDLELSQDMKTTYEYTRPYNVLPKYSTKYSNYYPPTEESTTYLIGECANNDY
ncbi:tetratricopeptide repeat protein [Candidatus Tisiphia endosymbiont of Oplodontha viridula]|uniref:tetratricopeptide repeat protein n=1 Tax=Candidatus Tisiphia endosymbiont of Oplodontha viridula TaxID=3077925 RepID=UPI0035C8C96F